MTPDLPLSVFQIMMKERNEVRNVLFPWFRESSGDVFSEPQSFPSGIWKCDNTM